MTLLGLVYLVLIVKFLLSIKVTPDWSHANVDKIALGL